MHDAPSHKWTKETIGRFGMRWATHVLSLYRADDPETLEHVLIRLDELASRFEHGTFDELQMNELCAVVEIGTRYLQKNPDPDGAEDLHEGTINAIHELGKRANASESVINVVHANEVHRLCIKFLDLLT